jgi:DNA-binding transcriptional LysR family regulator
MREINLDSVKLSQLRALVAIADHGNFSEAALHLTVSQSAISHAIATLEEELGIVLLSRGRHGATLTSVGERVLIHARQMLKLLEAIAKEANLTRGLQGGQVRIACFRSVASHVLPEIIARFRTRFPEIAVGILEQKNTESVEQALREGRADIGFTYLPTSPELEAWELLRDEYVVLLPPNVNLTGKVLTWEHLAAYPMIMPPKSDQCRLLIRNHLTKLGQMVEPTYEVSEDSTIVGMVSQGLGATIMARLAAVPLPAEVRVFNLPDPLERIIGVAILANALHSPAVYAFLEMLKSRHQESEPAIAVPPDVFTTPITHNGISHLGIGNNGISPNGKVKLS